jgi:hypothetical protein
VRVHGGGTPAGARPCRMNDGEDVPAVREHPLFVVAVWVTIALVAVTVVWLTAVLYTAPAKPAPAPAPWSCQSERAKVSKADAGGQIAPVCGQTPYPGSGP